MSPLSILLSLCFAALGTAVSAEPDAPLPDLPDLPALRYQPAAPPAVQPTAPLDVRGQADAALDALVGLFWDSRRSAFTAAPGGRTPAEYWNAAQALDAVLDGIERSGGKRWRDLPRAFIQGKAGGWKREEFDDENWMALALLRVPPLTGDASARTEAEALLSDIEANAADESCCGKHPGGLWWDRDHTEKATAINAGAVITAARVYRQGGDKAQLAFARKVFAYWLAEMVDPATGQVADHIDKSGQKVWWRFTYNEGTMIGAAVELYRATGETPYLDAAKKIGAFVRAKETVGSAAGPVLSDGSSCSGDCEQFKGIAQRYLAELASVDASGGWADLVSSDAKAIWQRDRDERTTTFGTDWAGPPKKASLATQSSAAMALSAAALAGH